jgi:circadian clock protein KaiB
MNKGEPDKRRAEKATASRRSGEGDRYILRLYVTGTTTRSSRAIVNTRKICEEYLPGRYELEVIDITQDPDRARDEQILAAPTLIKRLPLPLRRFIGDMSEAERLVVGLDISQQ